MIAFRITRLQQFVSDIHENFTKPVLSDVYKRQAVRLFANIPTERDILPDNAVKLWQIDPPLLQFHREHTATDAVSYTHLDQQLFHAFTSQIHFSSAAFAPSTLLPRLAIP